MMSHEITLMRFFSGNFLLRLQIQKGIKNPLRIEITINKLCQISCKLKALKPRYFLKNVIISIIKTIFKNYYRQVKHD
jgi:hypothetical protein